MMQDYNRAGIDQVFGSSDEGSCVHFSDVVRERQGRVQQPEPSGVSAISH